MSGLKQVNAKYQNMGFTITDFHDDNESEEAHHFYDQNIYTHALQMNTLRKFNYPYEQSRSDLDVVANLCCKKS